jgi:Ser/Thr protein kinase RdoA (MazF antagonist)
MRDGQVAYDEILRYRPHFINYLGDLTCPSIEPYTIVQDGFALSVAGFVEGHVLHFLPGMDTFTEEERVAVIASIGRWLADFHKASRQYAKDFPDELEKIQLWSERHGYLKPPPIPINEHTFGPIHGDFHTDNFHMSKLADGESWKVTAFDWGEL